MDADAITSDSMISYANTQLISCYIEEQAGEELLSILMQDPYPSKYEECLDHAQLENSTNARPELRYILR